MISTLLLTIVTESLVVLGYCIWQKKPFLPIWATSLVGNLLTQALLWLVLNLFYGQYLATLLVTEVLIWLIESLLLNSLAANQLTLPNALQLSLGMNLTSFALGWFLPI